MLDLAPSQDDAQLTKEAPHVLIIEDSEGHPVQIPAPPDTRTPPSAPPAPAAAPANANGGRGQRPGLCARTGQQLRDELYEYGRVVATAFQPGQGEHWILFSPAFTAVLCCAWVAMAAFLPGYLVQRNLQRCEDTAAATDFAACVSQAAVTNSTGPAYMLGWLQGDGGSAYDLPSPYLNQFGALYAPLMASADQWWRIFTSQFVHYNFVHLAGNAAVLLVLGSALERRHAAWRVALVWLAAVVGGEMLALLAEDPCDQVIGASGGDFGLVGLFAADFVLNWRELDMPLLHLGMTLVFIAILGATIATQANVSNMSHVGGVVTGLFVGLAVLPVLLPKRAPLQHALRVLGLVCFAAYFITTPWLVWGRVLPNLDCAVVSS